MQKGWRKKVCDIERGGFRKPRSTGVVIEVGSRKVEEGSKVTAERPQVNVRIESAQLVIVLTGAMYNEMSYVQTRWYRRTPILLYGMLI